MKSAKGWKATGALWILAASAFAGEKVIERSQVPPKVIAAAAAKYPRARMTGYELQTEANLESYEVQLDNDGTSIELTLSAEGKILSEETVVPPGELPGPVRASLARAPWSKARVETVERLVKGTDTSWEITLVLNGKKIEVEFDSGGKLVRKATPD